MFNQSSVSSIASSTSRLPVNNNQFHDNTNQPPQSGGNLGVSFQNTSENGQDANTLLSERPERQHQDEFNRKMDVGQNERVVLCQNKKRKIVDMYLKDVRRTRSKVFLERKIKSQFSDLNTVMAPSSSSIAYRNTIPVNDLPPSEDEMYELMLMRETEEDHEDYHHNMKHAHGDEERIMMKRITTKMIQRGEETTQVESEFDLDSLQIYEQEVEEELAIAHALLIDVMEEEMVGQLE